MNIDRNFELIGNDTIDCTPHCGFYNGLPTETESNIYIDDIKCYGCIAPGTFLRGETQPQKNPATRYLPIRACIYWSKKASLDINKLLHSPQKP